MPSPDPVAPPGDLNFAAHLLARNAARAARPAYRDDARALTYGDLDERVRRFATALGDVGLQRGERVLLLAHDSVDWPVAFLGALYAGVVPVAVNTLLTAADYGPWHVDYSAHAAGFPRVIRIRNSAPGEAGIDITARVEQLQVNTQINPLAWRVDVPSDADPMTLDELRSIAPLAERTKQN